MSDTRNIQDSDIGRRPKLSLGGIVRLLLGIGAIAYLLWANRAELAELERQRVQWSWLALGALLVVASVLLTFYRWLLLVRALALRFTLSDCLRIGSIGYFFNLLIPSAVGGDAVRIVLMAREHQRRAAAAMTVLMDRLVGLAGIVTFAGGLALIFWPALGSAGLRQIGSWAIALAVVAWIGLAFALSRWVYQLTPVRALRRIPRLGHLVAEVLDTLMAYRGQLRALAVGVGTSLVIQLLSVIGLWFLGRALVTDFHPVHNHMIVAPLGLMVGTIPITPGGLGLVEAAMGQLFEMSGSRAGTAVLMMLAYRGVQIAIAMVGLVFALADRKSRPLGSKSED